MTNFFVGCETLDQAKALYRKLALENHPDHGGNLETMQEINRQWADFQAQVSYKAETDRQQAAHREGRKTTADFCDLREVFGVIREKIIFALNLDGELEVELCGLWIWVTGNTKANREALKEAGFKWAPKKLAWYFAGVPSSPHHRHYTMDEIRNAYGSTRFAKPEEDRQPAYTPAGLHA